MFANRLRLLTLVGLIALVISTTTALAEKRVALVIGNSAYIHAAPLANPANDAEGVSALLTELGFEVVNERFFDTLTVKVRGQAGRIAAKRGSRGST